MNTENKNNEGQVFLQTLFQNVFNSDIGDIELRVFSKGKKTEQFFQKDIPSILDKAREFCDQNFDVYVGINPRIGTAMFHPAMRFELEECGAAPPPSLINSAIC